MTNNDNDAVLKRLSEHDDDLVFCMTDARGRTWYYKRSEMHAMTIDEIDWLLQCGEQLMSFSNKEGIRWLNGEDSRLQYPNWAGHKD